MSRTGVEMYSDALVDNLSGGERQRAWVSMLLAQQSPILILDEPTSALDVHHQFQLLSLLSTLSKTENKGIIVILHDLNLALRYATHIVALKKGKVAFSGNPEMLLDEQRLFELFEASIKLVDHPSPGATPASSKLAVVCQ